MVFLSRAIIFLMETPPFAASGGIENASSRDGASLGLGHDITITSGVYKPTYITGTSPCII